MKLGLINSAWAQAGRDTAYGIRMTKEIGFDTIDIFADPLDIDLEERRLIKRECDRAGLPIVSVACVAVGLIDFNPSVQRFHLERCRKYLELVHELDKHTQNSPTTAPRTPAISVAAIPKNPTIKSRSLAAGETVSPIRRSRIDQIDVRKSAGSPTIKYAQPNPAPQAEPTPIPTATNVVNKRSEASE